MSDSPGRLLNEATSATELVAIEADAGLDVAFSAIENLAFEVLSSSFAGSKSVTIRTKAAVTAVTLENLSAPARETVSTHLEVAAQQARGAWWLPESAPVKAGAINLPAHLATAPRWAMNSAALDSGRVDFRGNPDGLACWALLGPLADDLFAPLFLRGPEAGVLPPDKRDAAWHTAAQLYAELGLDSEGVTAALAAMTPGAGWSLLSVGDQVALRSELMRALADGFTPAVVRRWRVWSLRPVVKAFYVKAAKGSATSRAVLTKALQPSIAGIFGGDWLAFLEYLGEEPAPGEEITQVLPEARLYVQGSAKVEQVAAERDLPVADVAAMLASYMGSEDVRSPVERRVEVLREYWQVFDAAQARQAPGMDAPTSSIAPGIPEALRRDIHTLWGGTCLARYPDRVVSTRYPTSQMTGALGPAYDFWRNVALTAWYICESGYSRSDLSGMRSLYGSQVAALNKLGVPVDTRMFDDLRAAEPRLGKPQEIVTNREVTEVAPGMTVEISYGSGTRRDGFEILRDIITSYRRAWADQYLDAALRAQWEAPLRELAREVNRAVAARGKLPTVKQFAKLAGELPNHWFGGDLSAVYAAVGERSPITPVRIRLMPADRSALSSRVLTELADGQPLEVDIREDYAIRQRVWDLKKIAGEASRFIQLMEALDRPPTEQEFGTARLRWPEGVPFERFAETVERVRSELAGSATAMGEAREEAAERLPVQVSDRSVASDAAGLTAAEDQGEPGTPNLRQEGFQQDGSQEGGAPLPPAAWYPDPHQHGRLRWWDGQTWTEHVHPPTATNK